MKPIRLSPEQVQAIVQNLETARFIKEVTVGMPEYKDLPKAEIQYTPEAYCKVRALIEKSDAEIGWHNLVKRHEDYPHVFIVYDVLVFPQEVSGTSVVPDLTEYANWMNSLDTETFNSVRMHGHSHVNMSTTPSGTDSLYRTNILTGLTDDMFYIFTIQNKKGECYDEIYDLEYNIHYSNTDIISYPVIDGIRPKDWYDEVTKEVKKIVSNVATYPTYGNSVSGKLAESAPATTPYRQSTIADYDEDDFYERHYGISRQSRIADRYTREAQELSQKDKERRDAREAARKEKKGASKK